MAEIQSSGILNDVFPPKVFLHLAYAGSIHHSNESDLVGKCMSFPSGELRSAKCQEAAVPLFLNEWCMCCFLGGVFRESF